MSIQNNSISVYQIRGGSTMKNQILAYLESTINQYRRAYEETSSNTLKYMICDLEDFETFIEDLNNEPSKSTLELNADLRNNARAYKEDLAEKECTITTLATDLYNFGYIEKENKMLEVENLELRSKLAMTSVNERTIRELKADIQLWQTLCTEQRQKIEKLTGPHWVD